MKKIREILAAKAGKKEITPEGFKAYAHRGIVTKSAASPIKGFARLSNYFLMCKAEAELNKTEEKIFTRIMLWQNKFFNDDSVAGTIRYCPYKKLKDLKYRDGSISGTLEKSFNRAIISLWGKNMIQVYTEPDNTKSYSINFFPDEWFPVEKPEGLPIRRGEEWEPVPTPEGLQIQIEKWVNAMHTKDDEISAPAQIEVIPTPATAPAEIDDDFECFELLKNM